MKIKQYQSEQNEEELNLSCERKFVHFIMKKDITDLPVTSDDQSNVEFT